MRSKEKRKFRKDRCRYCLSRENLTIDHMIPISQGGKDQETNFQTLCYTCNGTKSGLSHRQVLRYFRWFLSVQEKRIMAGKKPYSLRKKISNFDLQKKINELNGDDFKRI